MIYICANCNRIITEDEPKVELNSKKKQVENKKISKRGSEKSIMNLASVKSFHKLNLCPIESQDEY